MSSLFSFHSGLFFHFLNSLSRSLSHNISDDIFLKVNYNNIILLYFINICKFILFLELMENF